MKISWHGFKFQFDLSRYENRFSFRTFFVNFSWQAKGNNWSYDNSSWGFYLNEGILFWYWNSDSYLKSFDFKKALIGDHLFVTVSSTRREDIYFKLAEKEFKINKIKWETRAHFYARIPFCFYNKRTSFIDITIDNPPMRRGKGENSYDLDDDGIYRLSRCFPRQVTWPKESDIKEAVSIYVECFFRDVEKHGSVDIKKNAKFEYIGFKNPEQEGCLCEKT